MVLDHQFSLVILYVELLPSKTPGFLYYPDKSNSMLSVLRASSMPIVFSLPLCRALGMKRKKLFNVSSPILSTMDQVEWTKLLKSEVIFQGQSKLLQEFTENILQSHVIGERKWTIHLLHTSFLLILRAVNQHHKDKQRQQEYK